MHLAKFFTMFLEWKINSIGRSNGRMNVMLLIMGNSIVVVKILFD
jgi:hypothetical protein